MKDIQVIVVEDNEQQRLSLRAALRAQPGIEVASEATNGTTGLVLLESIDVDVAVVDSSLPDMSLAEFVAQMRSLQAESCVVESRLLVLLDPNTEASWSHSLAVEADGYCVKTAPIEQLADMVQRIHRGEMAPDGAIAVLVSS